MVIPNQTVIFNRLRTRQLLLLLAIHEHHSLHKAADHLGMSQPAATKMLRDMEDLIGLKLFERGRRGLQPTPYGEVMTRYAQGVAADLAGVRDELLAIHSGNVGKIRVGAIMAPVPQLLSDTLLSIQAQHPRLAISILVGTSDVLITALREEHLDVVIGRIPDSWDGTSLVFEPIQDEALSIVCSPYNLAAQKPRLALKDLVEYPWVLQAHPSPMRKVIELSFVEARLALPLRIMETASMLLTSSLVRHSDMLAVMPTLVAKHYEAQGTLAIVPLQIRKHLPPFGILTRKTRSIRPATQVFIQELKAMAHSPRPRRRPDAPGKDAPGNEPPAPPLRRPAARRSSA